MSYLDVCLEFGFRIRTKDGEYINVYVDATDVDNARFKIRERYPDCQIVSDIQMRIM